MTGILEQIDARVLQPPADIVAALPHAPYNEILQPTYPDESALVRALARVQETESPTGPDNIDTLREVLGQIALGGDQHMVVIAGRCAEPLDGTSPREVANDSLAIRSAALEAGIDNMLFVLRSGNSAKPRSREHEGNGGGVLSFMGELINGQDSRDRIPDPARMVRAATQSRDVSSSIDAAIGSHQMLAHEALLLPYEQARLAKMPDGREYLLSADMPWIGARTNAANGPHVDMLRQVENPVGVKIGDDSTPEHIARLATALDPRGIPGKLTFMLRLSPGNTSGLGNILGAIARHAPHAVLLYDIHGVTRTERGHKIRALPEIAGQICTLAAMAHQHGLRLHGIHVEATGDSTRRECVDGPNELPEHPGGIDPQLRPDQLTWLLQTVAHCFGQRRSAS